MNEEERALTTGNEWSDIALSFIPGFGAAMDVEDAVRDPSLQNIGWAFLSTLLDFAGASWVRGAGKAAIKSVEALDAIKRYEKASKIYNRTLEIYKNNPTKGNRRLLNRTFIEARNAKNDFNKATKLIRRRGSDRRWHTIREMPSDVTNIVNNRNIYLTDGLLNTVQQIVSEKQGGQLIPRAKSGIHIKKANRGKFTDYCGGTVTNECIQKAKKSSNPILRKRATFAQNARRWSKKK